MTVLFMIIFTILEVLNLNWLFRKAQNATYSRDAKSISSAITCMLILLYTIIVTGGKL